MLPYNSPSHTGDLYAVTRVLSPLSLAFSSISRVAGNPAAHYLSGGAVAVALIFGVRQGVHSLVLQRRRLQALSVVRRMLEQELRANGSTTTVEALLTQNDRARGEALLATVAAGSASLGSLGIAVGTLLREPLLGALAHAASAAALPILYASLGPLALPAALSIVERGCRFGQTFVDGKRIDKQLAECGLPHTELVRDLYRRRQHELRLFYGFDIATRCTVTAGAFTTVFTGPIGLSILIPGVIASLVSDIAGRRYVSVDDALPMKERLALRTQEDIHNFIFRVHRDVEAATELRQVKTSVYPPGWTTPLRPALKLLRSMQRQKELPSAERILAQFAARHAGDGDEHPLAPIELFELFADLNLFDTLAETLLRSRTLRRALDGHGILRQGSKWAVAGEQLAEFLTEQQGRGPEERQQVDKVYRKAEEVLLTHGKVLFLRRQRAVLRFLEDFIKTQAAMERANKPQASMERADSDVSQASSAA